MKERNVQSKMDNRELRAKLESFAEPEFRDFSSRLIPDLGPGEMLGVRLPRLRKIAAKIAGEDWRDYLTTAEDNSFEEIMLQGMVIGCAKMPLEERLQWVRWFLPKIGNWSICDSFCAGLKAAREEPVKIWEFLQPCFVSGRTYEIRFGVVMLINYFVGEEWIGQALALLDGICHEDYYVKMAVAWAVSMYYVKFPERTLVFLRDNHLDTFTYNKALQKITESRQVDAAVRERIRAMKRKV